MGFTELNLVGGDSELRSAEWQVSARGLPCVGSRVAKKVEGYMRNEWARIVLALLLGVTMIGSGCSTNWVQQGQEIIAVLMPAAANFVPVATTTSAMRVMLCGLTALQST